MGQAKTCLPVEREVRSSNRASQVRHIVANDSPFLQHFIKKSCFASRRNAAEMGTANSLQAVAYYNEYDNLIGKYNTKNKSTKCFCVMNNAFLGAAYDNCRKIKTAKIIVNRKLNLTAFKIPHKTTVVSTIKAVLTIVGGFHDLSCLIIFVLQTRIIYIIYFSIFLVCNSKKLNSVNCENH